MIKSTIKDVARVAGVSDTTVSLAFQPNSRISERTRARVLSVAAQLSYAPNLAAKNLRNGSSRTIGFVVNDVLNPFYLQMFRKAEDIALQHGYGVIFAGSNWSAEKERHLFEQMIQMRVCGMVLCLCEKSSDGIATLDRFSVPYIAVDSYPGWYAGSYVANDFCMAGELAAKHLLVQGCRRPAYFTADRAMNNLSAFIEMQKSFIAYFNRKGIEITQADVIEAGLCIQGGRDAFERISVQGKRYDGIFCANDFCAMGVLEAAEKHGIIPGKDIAVIGIDDTEVSGFSKISLTSIRQPYNRLAAIAMEELIKAIQADSIPNVKRKLPAELMVRNSSKLES
ncbi:MAG: LacI family transcriptional regulator [Lentisphaerae bacterium]|nr:LacI family transcriptional regulator [Lentisphaerota bacterium]OQC15048.1 MAG: Ribose operon repressor [Lentisphaerae bacterium ADurb.Bin082]